MTAKTGGICGGIDAFAVKHFSAESDSCEVNSVLHPLRQ